MFKSLAKSHHFPEIITTCEIHAAWFYFQSWKQKKSPPKKQKIKNCRHRKKSESLFLELSLEGHCLDRPLWRHCGGGCLIGDCCSRLWGSDRGAATRATEEPPTERGATGPSPRTLWAPSHTALPITFTHVGWPCQSFSAGAETSVFLASNEALWYERRGPKLQSPKSQAYVLTNIWVL